MYSAVDVLQNGDMSVIGYQMWWLCKRTETWETDVFVANDSSMRSMVKFMVLVEVEPVLSLNGRDGIGLRKGEFMW